MPIVLLFFAILAAPPAPPADPQPSPPRSAEQVHRGLVRAHAFARAGDDLPQIVYWLNQTLEPGEPRYTIAEARALLMQPAPSEVLPAPSALPPAPAPPPPPRSPISSTRRLYIHRLHAAGFPIATIVRDLNESRPASEDEWTEASIAQVLNEPLPEAEALQTLALTTRNESSPWRGGALGIEILSDHGGGVVASAFAGAFGAEAHFRLRTERFEDAHGAAVIDGRTVSAGAGVYVGAWRGPVRTSVGAGLELAEASDDASKRSSTGTYAFLDVRLDVLVAEHAILGLSFLRYQHQLTGDVTGAPPIAAGAAGFDLGLFGARVSYLFP